MLKGYNLAFMPINHSQKFVQFAHEAAKGVKVADYLLGPDSLPHVSICHFMMDDTEIENIWHHLTLFNSYDIDSCKHFNHMPIIQPLINDDFVIALGHIDRIGQVTDILFTS